MKGRTNFPTEISQWKPVFQYCSDVWQHCGARSRDKLEQLNKQVLRVVLDDQSSTYEELLRKLHMVTLDERRVRNMLVTVHNTPTRCRTVDFTNLSSGA